jgi:spore photoproduct lyase
MPPLKQIIEKRFPESVICYGEFITGLDNKMRYFKPLRIELYGSLISHIRTFSTDILVYFCMEDKQVWESCMGFFPSGKGELGAMLDKSAVTHCNLDHTLI